METLDCSLEMLGSILENLVKHNLVMNKTEMLGCKMVKLENRMGLLGSSLGMWESRKVMSGCKKERLDYKTEK